MNKHKQGGAWARVAAGALLGAAWATAGWTQAPEPTLLAPAYEAAGAATEPVAPVAPLSSAAKVQFSFEQADIRLVTQIVGKYINKKFVVPEGVTGRVSILVPEPVPVSEIYPLYLNALEASGYTVVERAGVCQVTPLPAGPSLPASLDAADGLVTKLIPLQHVSAVHVKKSFEGLVRGGREGGLEVFAPGNHLIVTDTAGNVARLEALVAQIDQPGTGNVIEVVPLKYASVEAVAEQLRATIGATDSAVNKINRHFEQVAGGTGSLPTDFTVVPVPQANSLILVGLPMQIDRKV